MKRFSTSCVIRKMKIKTTRYPYTPIPVAKIQNTQHQMLVRMWSNRTPHSLLMAVQNSAATSKISYKTKHTLLYDPADPAVVFFGIYPKELKTCVHTWMHMDVYSSFIHSCKTWKQSRCPSVGEWINKLWYT